ncbi:hypothetical protein [Phenylobacterium sp.]|uniref:hypothetical protein n=1 Tax=Phenylobacterium sp. TaxID=1871053 RepID=UPI0025F5FC27|nr:hypothetical protein [Phenylobacterium sp.]MBX3484365.1 hypothetical protein [Phenylobacterium sp.]MCW5758693.1 hypothetical protein [Phenylobacterium sp.]
MDIRTALSLAGACAAMGVFAGWRGARPPDPMKGPRMIPWRWVMVLAATLALTFGGMAAHLALGR